MSAKTVVSHTLYPVDRLGWRGEVGAAGYILIPGHFPFFKVQSETSQLPRRGVGLSCQGVMGGGLQGVGGGGAELTDGRPEEEPQEGALTPK